LRSEFIIPKNSELVPSHQLYHRVQLFSFIAVIKNNHNH